MRSRLGILLLLVASTALAQRSMGGRGRNFPERPAPAPALEITGPVVQLRAETRVVEIDVTARGKQGQAVDNLHQADFTILVDGHPQPFSLFSFNPADAVVPAVAAAPNAPPGAYSNRGAAPRLEAEHSVAVLIDAYNGWFENFNNAGRAVLGALAKLPADERIALYVIDRYKGMQLLVDYTTDRARVRTALTKYTPGGTCPAPPGEETPGDGTSFVADLGPPPPVEDDSPDAKAQAYKEAFSHSPCQGAGRAGAAVLRDGVESARLALEALATSLESLPGRKSVFWITQGFPPSMLEDTDHYQGKGLWDKTLARLNDANVAVNTLDSNGIAGPQRLWGPGGVLTMQQVSATTGGTTFYNNADLAAALTRGIAQTRASYALGFYLKKLDGKYHTLKVAVDRLGVTLNYRAGYYAMSDEQRAAANKKTDLRTALLNPAGATGVGITAKLASKDGQLDLWLNLDPSTLTVRGGNGGWTGEVDELFIERNADGREVGRESDNKRFQMTARGRAEVERDGLNLTRSLRPAPGATELEIVVRDHDSGRIGSLSLPLPAAPPAPASPAPAGK